jgi:TPR repeat protein
MPSAPPPVVAAESPARDPEADCDRGVEAACHDLYLRYDATDRDRALGALDRTCKTKSFTLCDLALHHHVERAEFDRAEVLYRQLECNAEGASCDGKVAHAYAYSLLFRPVRDRDERARRLFDRGCTDQSGEVCVDFAGYLGKSGDNQDIARAEKLFDRECKHGSPQACFSAAQLLAEKPSIADPAGAETRFVAVCGADVDCKLQAARSFARGHQNARAKRLLEPACTAGRRDACVSLAHVLVEEKNYPRAKTLYQDACDHGDGCTGLAGLYEAGLGVPKDEAKARAIIERACAANDALACSFKDNIAALGKIFLNDLGGTMILMADLMLLWPLEGLAQFLAISMP